MSKTFLVCGVAALGLLTCSAQSTDTEADLKLREALRRKIAETTPGQPAAAPPSAPVVKAAPAAAGPVAAPVTAPVVVERSVAPAVTSEDDDAQTARLREALRQRMGALPPEPAAATTKVAGGSDQQPVVSTTKVTATPAEARPAAPVPVTMTAPASPLPASKEQRLDSLLQQYKADLISPQEYHTQRAKILAE